MTNEEKVLELLSDLKKDIGLINGRLDNIEYSVRQMQDDITDIKEDAAITRSAANKLIEWAEATHLKVGKPVPDFPIMQRAEG